MERLSRGAAQVGELVLGDGGVYFSSGNGAPTNGVSGTLAGKAAPGSIYVDYANGGVYFNTNTKASPTWSQLTIN